MNSGTRNSSDLARAGHGAQTRMLRDRVHVGGPLRREAGMTALGFLILVVFIGLFAFAAIRLTPVYLNYMKVAGVVNGVFDEFDGQAPSRGAIQTSIARRFGVESVSEIDFRDVKVTPESGGFQVEAAYSHTTPFIGNIYFTVKFEKSVLVRR